MPKSPETPRAVLVNLLATAPLADELAAVQKAADRGHQLCTLTLLDVTVVMEVLHEAAEAAEENARMLSLLRSLEARDKARARRSQAAAMRKIVDLLRFSTSTLAEMEPPE